MIIWNILLTLGLSICAGILYRAGGSDTYNTKVRDLGVPTIMLLYFILTGHFHWSLLLCFGLLFGSLTTYWKRKGQDAHWWNWALCGLGFSIAMLPLIFFTGHWVGFLVRTVVLTVWTTVWSELEGNAVREEFGRGAGIIATLPFI